MAVETTNYQCPACGGPLRYDGGRGMLVCDYCDSTYEVAQVEQMYAAQQAADEAASDAAGEFDLNEQGMKVYACPSCGAELVTSETTAVSQCPYCGNPTVVPGVLRGEFRPDLVIPFKLDHKAATDALENYYKGKKFLPRAFVQGNRIEEVQGVYVPFWLFDARATGDASYEAVNTRTFRQGDDEVTEEDHYRAYRAGTLEFSRVPVDGSTRMPDAHMDAIEPFDYGSMVPYSVAYLPGFLADRYDQTAEECRARAESRIEASFQDELESSVRGYDHVSRRGGSTQVSFARPAYALLPVWMLSTRWENESFLFAMNGQTGRLVGNLPVQRGKVVAWFLAIAIPVTVIVAAIFMYIGMFEENGTVVQVGVSLLIGCFVAAIACSSFYDDMKTAQTKEQASDYLSGAGLVLSASRDDFMGTTRDVRRVSNK